MIKFWIFTLLSLLASCYSWWLYVGYVDQWWGTGEFSEHYSQSARTPLFTGFITLGSFMLTLKTAILVRLKEGYDSEKNKDAYRLYLQKCKNSKVKAHPFYASLVNLSRALNATIGLALLAALVQLTLGFELSRVSLAICAGFPCFTLLMVGFLCYQMLGAESLWFAKIEDDARRNFDLDGTQSEDRAETLHGNEVSRISRP